MSTQETPRSNGSSSATRGQRTPHGESTPANGTRRRFTPEEKARALDLIASGLRRSDVAAAIGCSGESIRRWVHEAEEKGTMPAGSEPRSEQRSGDAEPAETVSPPDNPQGRGRNPDRSPYAPADPAQGLGDHEVAAILELKRRNPSMGPAQLRAQLKRFQGWRISIKAIARVLRGHGYELVHRGSRPKGPEPIRFEAIRRNALWQADFAEVRIGQERLYLLLFIDDFSRFVIGHALGEGPTSEVATETLKRAIARHGKPEAVRTDRGGAFLSWSRENAFGRFLEDELIDHVVGKPYRPQGGGKVEALIGTIRRELWDIQEFIDRAEAEQKVAAFIEDYNERRAHMGIGGLTPADRFFGRADQILAAVDAISRNRQGARWARSLPGEPVEEVLSSRRRGPFEVLRLVIVEGTMELHFCGARVKLGPIEA